MGGRFKDLEIKLGKYQIKLWIFVCYLRMKKNYGLEFYKGEYM